MKALIINGPNLNMLGKRNKDHYGTLTLVEINELIINTFSTIKFTFYQSNHEGQIIDVLQNIDDYDFLIINAGAYSHTSVAIKDALEIIDIPIGVCHLSNIENREEYRKIDLLKEIATSYVVGLKEKSYLKVIENIINTIDKENK